MSYKVNLANPERKMKLLERRYDQCECRKATDPKTHFEAHRYVPGNGPNHKLGRKTNEG